MRSQSEPESSPRGDAARVSRGPAWAPGGIAGADVLTAALIAAGACTLYALTSCRSIFWDDSAELAVVFPLLDIAHPTGYPLITLIGKLFTLVPIGAIAFRANLVAAVAGAAASGLLYLLVREMGLEWIAAVFGAGLWAVSRELWDQSTAAEVYSLHACLTAAVLLAALRFMRTRSRAALVSAAALTGLAFANHLTSIWTIPAILWLGLAGGRGIPARRDIAISLVALAAALSLYLYLPVRSSQGLLFDNGETARPASFIRHVTGSQFRYRMFVEAEKTTAQEASDFARLMTQQWTPWLLPLAALGLYAMTRRNRAHAGAFVALVAANLFFDLNYHIPDKPGYFLPVWMSLAIWIAEGIQCLMGRCAARKHWQAVAAIVLLAGVLQSAHTNQAFADKSANCSLADYTDEILRRLPNNSLLIVDDLSLMWSASSTQLIEHRYQDRIVISDYLLCLPWYVHHLRRRYPGLELDERVDELLAERSYEVQRARGRQIGEISARYTERIARSVAEASLPRRRIFCCFRDTKDRETWNGFRLLDRGLCYEVFARESDPEAEVWDIDYPHPARYLKTAIPETNWKHVASIFATSCNRAGIALIKTGRAREAEAALLRAVEYDPEYAQAYLNLGVLYHQYLPDRAKRDRSWRRFLELAPSDLQSSEVQRELGR